MATDIVSDASNTLESSPVFVARTFALQPLTPIWTGNANREMDRIHETGILGSLRWWYEALVRGIGGWACDPTIKPATERCLFDIKKYKKARADIPTGIGEEDRERYLLRMSGVCDVCQLFGATNWRRRVQFQIEGQEFSHPIPGADKSAQKTITRKRPTPGNPNHTKTLLWLVPDGAPAPFKLTMCGDSASVNEIANLIELIIPRAAIGPRTQMGYGVVAFGDTPNAEFPELAIGCEASNLMPSLASIKRLKRQGMPPNAADPRIDGRRPSSDRMFFARVHLNALRDQDPVKEMLHTKADLRDQFRGPNEENLRHRIMGTVSDGKIGAKINVSRPYSTGESWQMRIWGWAPANDIAIVKQRIATYLTARVDATVVWKEGLP